MPAIYIVISLIITAIFLGPWGVFGELVVLSIYGLILFIASCGPAPKAKPTLKPTPACYLITNAKR